MKYLSKAVPSMLKLMLLSSTFKLMLMVTSPDCFLIIANGLQGSSSLLIVIVSLSKSSYTFLLLSGLSKIPILILVAFVTKLMNIFPLMVLAIWPL